MSQINLKVEKREKKSQNLNKMRKEGLVPAVVYGKGEESLSLKLKSQEFKKAYAQARTSVPVDLDVADGNTLKVLVQAVDFDTLTDEPIHIDFLKVTDGQMLKAKVPFKVVGKSKAVTLKGGILMKKLDFLKVKCLPENLPASVELDSSVLEDLNQSIRIRDIELGEGVQVLNDPNIAVLTVTKTRKATVQKAVDTPEVATEEGTEATPTENGEKTAEPTK